MYLRDLFDFLELQPTIHSLPGALTAPRPIRSGFEFQNVTFAYPGSERAVVSHIHFRLDAGEKVDD